MTFFISNYRFHNADLGVVAGSVVSEDRVGRPDVVVALVVVHVGLDLERGAQVAHGAL